MQSGDEDYAANLWLNEETQGLGLHQQGRGSLAEEGCTGRRGVQWHGRGAIAGQGALAWEWCTGRAAVLWQGRGALAGLGCTFRGGVASPGDGCTHRAGDSLLAAMGTLVEKGGTGRRALAGGLGHHCLGLLPCCGLIM